MKRKWGYFLFIFIFIFSFSIGMFTSPAGLLSPLFLYLKNVCATYLPAGDGIFNVLKHTISGQTYRIGIFLSCPLIRWFGTDVIPYKIVSSLLYGVFGVTTFLLLKKISEKDFLSFFSTILTLLLPQFVFYSWPVLDFTNIIGAWFVFLLCILFFKDFKMRITALSLYIPLSFLSSFVSEQSRLYALPFLLLLYLFYPERRNRNSSLFIIIVFFFTALSLVLHASLASRPSLQFEGIKGLFLSVVYYTHFIVCYFIYSYDYLGLVGFISSFFRFYEEKSKRILFYLFFLSGFSVAFFMPLYPYAELGFNFFFVTPSIPWQFFGIGIAILISSIYSIKKSPEKWERFSFSAVVISSSILIFVMGIYPRIRDDPSARHILVVFPLFTAIILKNILDLFKKQVLFKILGILLLSIFIRNLSPLYSLVDGGRNLYNLANELRGYFLNISRKTKGRMCIFYINPQYYITAPDDILFSFKTRETRVFTHGAGQEYLEFCKKRSFGIFWRFRPSSDPMYLKPGEDFFRNMKPFLPYGDQLNIAHFSEMHTPLPLPLEEELEKNPLVFKAEARYKVPPLFFNELIHRLKNHIPFFLEYRYYFKVYEENEIP